MLPAPLAQAMIREASFLDDTSREYDVTREKTRTEAAKRRFLNVWTVVGAILLTGVVVYLMNILSGLSLIHI